MVMPYHVAVHKGSGGLGYDEAVRMLVPALPRKGDPETVYDWSEINLGSGVNGGSLQVAPRLDRHEVALQDDTHVMGGKVNRLYDLHKVNISALISERLQQVHLGFVGEGGVYCLCRWYIESGSDLMQASC